MSFPELSLRFSFYHFLKIVLHAIRYYLLTCSETISRPVCLSSLDKLRIKTVNGSLLYVFGFVAHNQQSKTSPTSNNSQYVKYVPHFQIFSKFFPPSPEIFLKNTIH